MATLALSSRKEPTKCESFSVPIGQSVCQAPLAFYNQANPCPFPHGAWLCCRCEILRESNLISLSIPLPLHRPHHQHIDLYVIVPVFYVHIHLSGFHSLSLQGIIIQRHLYISYI